MSEAGSGSAARERPAVRFTTGLTRVLLRNLPTVLLLILAIYVPATFLNQVTTGQLQVDLPRLTLDVVGLLLPGILGGGLWLYLVYRILASSLPGASLHRSLVFFATAVPLAAGTGHAANMAWTKAGTGADPALTV